jgi:hypothetical protein
VHHHRPARVRQINSIQANASTMAASTKAASVQRIALRVCLSPLVCLAGGAAAAACVGRLGSRCGGSRSRCGGSRSRYGDSHRGWGRPSGLDVLTVGPDIAKGYIGLETRGE